MRKRSAAKYRATNLRALIVTALLVLALAGYLAWIVSGSFITPGDVAAKGATNVKLEQLKIVLSVLGTVGAAIVFVIGLIQYDTAQQWKRTEFVVDEFKGILQQPKVVTALQMVDAATRSLQLGSVVGSDVGRRTTVTLRMQCRALMPHTLIDSSSFMRLDSEIESQSVETDGMLGSTRQFTPEEEDPLIRDCYDALFDCFSYIGHYLGIGLIGTIDLQPYVRYWIDSIAEKTDDTEYAIWNVCLFTYIHVYHYDGVTTLFEKFGYDILPTGELFRSFIAVLHGADLKLASNLQALAIQELR